MLAGLIGCSETQELFPGPGRAGADGSSTPASEFHLVSVGANAQVDRTGTVNGLGAAIILKDERVLYWGNGGEAAGRGFSVAVVDPETLDLQGAVQSFDTYSTRQTGAGEAARLGVFLQGVAEGMLVLLVVGDDAGLTYGEDRTCIFFEDASTQRVLDLLVGLGSRHIREYCYRASWAMAAYQGFGRAEAEALADGSPAHVVFRAE